MADVKIFYDGRLYTARQTVTESEIIVEVDPPNDRLKELVYGQVKEHGQTITLKQRKREDE